MAIKPMSFTPDWLGSELLNFRLHNLASAPSSPQPGRIYYNTSTQKPEFWNGASWVEWGVGGASGDVVGPAASVDSEIAIFNGTTGKIIKRATITGLAKLTSGVLSAAVAGTDFTTPSSTESFTNKTFDANGSGNTISNIETADLAAGVLNTSTTLAGATNSQLPSAAAVKAYVDANLAANDAMVFKGGIDCSTNPNYPAANAGDTYKVTVAGLIGGGSGVPVTVGDTLYCTADGTSAGNHATVGASWTIVQANVDAATTATQGLVELATQAEAEAKADTVRAVTPAALVRFPQKREFTFGDGSANSFALTHNLGTNFVTVEVFKVSTGQTWGVDVVRTSNNVVTVTFTGVVPTSNEFSAVVTG